MANKVEVNAQWADMRQRLLADPKLAAVLDALDVVLPKDGGGDEPRSRLKTPYATAAPIDNKADWN